MVDNEKTAQSMPRNAGPRFLSLTVVCNGLLSIAQRRWRAALMAEEFALQRRTEILAEARVMYFVSGEKPRKPA